MKFIRYTFITLLFLICMPLSWYAAWDASSSFIAVAFSFMLPTWGLAYWGLVEAFGQGFGIGAGAFILGMIGAYVSLMLFMALNPDDS